MDVNSTITGPDVRRGFHPQARDDSAAGTLVLEGRTGEAASQGDTRIWAGRIGDPFYIDLSLLGIVNAAVKNGTAVDLSAWRPEAARNSFADTTVESILLEVPHQHPQLRPGARVGVWCATKLATDARGWRQVNRFGHPMMWPIFWPDDTDFSNPADARHPSEDFDADGKYIGDHIAAAVSASGTADDLEGYGQTVARELFPQRHVVRDRAAAWQLPVCCQRLTPGILAPWALTRNRRGGVEIMDGATVSVAVVTSRTEADLIAGMLRSHGLGAAVSADDAGGQYPQMQAEGVHVLVAPGDEALARRLIAAADDPAERASDD